MTTLDEPTAMLSPVEVEGLFRVIEALNARGTAVLFVSHKLDEVIRLVHRVTSPVEDEAMAVGSEAAVRGGPSGRQRGTGIAMRVVLGRASDLHDVQAG